MTMNTTAKTSVSVRDLTIAYGNTTVLDKLSLDVAHGEFLVLLGSSGCGKSTLLNAIAGLGDISGGEVWISDKDVTWAEPKDRGIGMVFQSYALYPRMTVEQNMSFGLKIKGLKTDHIRERVQSTASLLQIEHLLKRRPADLSGGQRQRVAIGRALVREVDVFLFDEPLSNLDAQLRSELRVEIKKLHHSLGNTMIYVTHDQVEAMTLADRIAVMKNGQIQQLAPPAEVYARPANLFVAGFLGSPKMNFLQGTLSTQQGKPVFTCGQTHIDLSAAAITSTAYQGEATLGIRPEHLAIVSGAGAPGQKQQLEGSVSLIEPLGAETIVWVNFQGASLTIRTTAYIVPSVGDRVSFSLDLTRASVFAADSGLRL
ncbi:ABC transporter ATP-binding protein [Pararhizobium gei]|uniref:ABC transporter ATP-binding protein n=1 Tax=Pararhizobium gei TaxID=1395951 RepID=UPI0023DB2950|nr:ABC transporter ATP-binding protein [Rhizobium gei]